MYVLVIEIITIHFLVQLNWMAYRGVLTCRVQINSLVEKYEITIQSQRSHGRLFQISSFPLYCQFSIWNKLVNLAKETGEGKVKTIRMNTVNWNTSCLSAPAQDKIHSVSARAGRIWATLVNWGEFVDSACVVVLRILRTEYKMQEFQGMKTKV